MTYQKAHAVPSICARFAGIALLAGFAYLVVPAYGSVQKHTPAPSKPAAHAPSHGSSNASHPANRSTGGRPGANGNRGTGGRPGSARVGAGNRGAGGGTVRNRDGSTTTRTARGGEVTRGPHGRVTSYRGANGREAKFGSNGRVREVRGNGMTVSRGPRGMRRTEVERGDHSRLVAYGHGRGYISRPYSYRGHSYYSRAYYRHGGYYRAYYHPYYYHGIYLHGYIPAYYYPPVYYGWAYNPWAVPVAYAWGWGGNPWYGYYGAYFAPYPVYPSAAYWLADYMVAASLADAYAAANAAEQSGQLRSPNAAPRLIFAAYDPETGTTSPTMTKEVKDAVAQEIQRELAAAQKDPDPSNGDTASLATLLSDGQAHVFVVNAGLTVTSAGQDCGLTEGDVLGLDTPPAADATTADLHVLASKQEDCAKGNVVTVDLNDLQEMHNHLLANIDSGMAQMKDHPGQGGLPAPPAAAIQGTTQAPYAAAAPAADPNGAAELDQQAQAGAQLEQQVVADATAPDNSGETPAAASGGYAASAPAAPARPSGPITISLGQTPEQVIASKGQPTNKVEFPTKTIFIYPDMKIIFVHGKVSDVQ
jgi:hypothetical protein